MIRLKLLLFALALAPVFADTPHPVVVNAVTDRYRPLAPDQQKLAGVLSERMRATGEGYLERVNDAALFTPVGEQAGRFLDAAVSQYEYSHDPNLKAVMDRVAKELLAHESPAANAEGQISSVDPKVRNTPNTSPFRGDLLGEIAYYRVTGDGAALTASEKLGDSVLSIFGKTTASRNSAPRALLEPFVYLYRYTGDSLYLDFTESLAASWLAAKPARIDPTYENLSDLVGLIELYRITGDESYFRPVVAAWSDLRANHLTLTGTPIRGSGDTRSAENDDTTELCITASWIQLTLDLLRITGESQYAEQLERTIYNQLFAAEDARTGHSFSSAPLNGRKKLALTTDTCVAAEAKALSTIPSAVWGRYGNGIAVVLYTAGRATFRLRRRGTVQLYSEATYPETGDILLHVEPSRNMQFPLRLRVPEWTSRFVADVGASHLIGKPGEFLTITREWKRGDAVKIAIDMTVHVIDGAPAYPERVAIQRGPQVLALGHTLNPNVTDLSAAGPISTDPSQLRVPTVESRFPANWAGSQAYIFPGEYEGRRQELVLIPFADAIDCRVWMKKPIARSGATDH